MGLCYYKLAFCKPKGGFSLLSLKKGKERKEKGRAYSGDV